MSLQKLLNRMVTSLFVVGLILSCGANVPDSSSGSSNKGTAQGGISSLDINLLEEGTEITIAGQQLMDQPLGVVKLVNGDARNDSVLVMAVHGYDSRGYEWIMGLKNLTNYFGPVFFFRYDWERCPEEIAKDLANEIKKIEHAGKYEKIVIFGHSYGGMVVTFAASQLGRLEADIHIIAAPLSGFPNLLDECSQLSYDKGDKLIYPEWNKSVRLFQHKTVHAQDGAFRDLASDPQNVDLPFYQILTLPPTMDGHRLGHNWSVTWVLDKYVGRPHHL